MSLPWRTVSLFVSSTFRDTQLERDILVRRVFPGLRQSLSKHRINLAEIDLRWGVTSEQDSVQVCEEVLKESLPRFLGIIGARYGWIPDRDNPEGISITEREMRMALEHPAARPVFLLRDPAVPDGLSDPDSLTDADDEANLATKQARLSALLDFVRSSKSDIYTYQATATNGILSLGTTFEDTAYAAILSSLENDPELTPWFELTAGDTDVSFAEAAQAFAHERTRGFNASLRSREIADLDVASKTDGYVLVTGGGGLGKSSLVAQAYLSAIAGGDRKVVGAFVGGMLGTGSSHELLTNLLRSLSGDPPETDMTKLAEQFLSALHTAKPRLFLDGLDQLSDAGRLSWLPYGLPAGTTVVISTMDDALAQPFRDRGAVEIRMDALTITDARTVLLGHLHRYRKVLEPRQVDALLAKTDATSPLYLACVAEELRTLGVREELDKHIAAMPPDVGGLFLWVLRRLETDRQFRWENGSTKVRRLMSCLGVSRDGLSESELCDLVDDASGDVAVLLRLLQPYLSRRGDLLSLHHRAHGEALRGIGIGDESRRLLGDEHPGYLDEESEIDSAREVLARYFDATGSSVVSERQAYEWPHQLFHLKAWDWLELCLLTWEIFEHLSDDERKWELTGYWHPLRAEPLSRDMGALYLESFEKWKTGDNKLDASTASSLGSFLHDNGLYDSAEPLCSYAMEIRERILGPEHPDTLTSVNNLALLLYVKGDHAGAEPLNRRAHVARTRTLGPEHPDTLTSLSSMASLLSAIGDVAGAEPLYRRVLEVRERTLGPEHPDTLTSVNNMAFLLYAKGDLAGSERWFRRSFETCERTLGPEHINSLISANNLANLLRTKGDLAGAEPLFRGVLEKFERTLGPEHPGTLINLNSLAVLLLRKGDLAGAEPLFRRALEASERTIGLEHPDTLKCVNNLALLLQKKRDLTGAESLYRRTLETRERLRGPEHPDTLTSVNNIASLLRAKGDLDGAESLFRQALEASERTLGPEHPNTLTSVNNLAVLLRAKGDLAGSEPLSIRTLEARERILGPEHPDTLKSVINMAILLKEQGDLADAEPLYRRALETRERILGPEHPDTLKARQRIERLLETTRIVELIKGRKDCERCLGTGFVANADIVRLGMQSEWTPGPCQLCREAAGL
jgi:tetratricopeptide (TPR) repeat protein